MFRPNNRARVYTSWRDAVCAARNWGHQTGRKYRVLRFRNAWIVRKTPYRTGPFDQTVVAKNIGEVRLTVVYDVGVMFPTLSTAAAAELLATALR